jgi:hypothetical protein
MSPIKRLKCLIPLLLFALAAPSFAQTRSLVFEDTFTRADSALGGVGNGWIDAGNKYQVLGNAMTAVPIASPNSYSRIGRPESIKDVSVEFTTSPWALSTGPSIRASIRYVNQSNYYLADLNLGAGGGTTTTGSIALRRMIGGVTTTLASSSFAATPGNRYQVTRSAVGTGTATLTATVFDVGPYGQGSPLQVGSVSTVDTATALQVAGTTGVQLGHYIYNAPGALGIAALTAYRVYSVDTGGGTLPARFPANDNRVYWSPNWADEGTGKRTSLAGAYLKTSFYGTSAALTLDTSSLASIPAGNCPKLAWSIDNKPYAVAQIAGGQTNLPLAANLPDGLHTLRLYVMMNYQASNVWGSTEGSGALPANCLRIQEIVLDPGATLAAPSVLPKTILVYGDSITRSAYDATNQSDADSRQTFVSGLAEALGAEVGLFAHAGQGWSLPAGPIPAFTATWEHIDALTPISLTSPPHAVFVFHGRNGSLSASTVTDWLTAARAKFGPGVPLICCIAFAGTNRAAETAGFNAYQSASGDPNVYLLDLQTDSWFATGVSQYSLDGIHLYKFAHGVAGAKVVGQTAKAVPGVF